MNLELVTIIRVQVFIIVILFRRFRRLVVKSKLPTLETETPKAQKIETEIYQRQKRHNQHHKQMQTLIEP